MGNEPTTTSQQSRMPNHRTPAQIYRLSCVFVLSSILLGGCGESTPYGLTKVSGTITYQDGTLIPAETLLLQFQPQAAAIDSKTHPRPGQSYVDTKTGKFEIITTYKYDDGLIRGDHKVVVVIPSREIEFRSLNKKDSKSVVPKEFTSSKTTPLMVNTEDAPF